MAGETSILGLMIRPWRLDRAARSVSVASAAAACVALMVWYSVLLGLAWGLAISEPYGWVEGWLQEVVIKLRRPGFWLLCAFFIVAACGIIGFAGFCAAAPLIRHRALFRAAWSVVLLWPVTFFIPATVSLGCALTWELPATWRDGTPLTWHLARPVQALGSCVVPVAAILFSLIIMVQASYRVRCEFAEIMRRLCHHCQYDRTGLAPGAVCPECGRAPIPVPVHDHGRD